MLCILATAWKMVRKPYVISKLQLELPLLQELLQIYGKQSVLHRAILISLLYVHEWKHVHMFISFLSIHTISRKRCNIRLSRTLKIHLLNNLHHLKSGLQKSPRFSSINNVKEMRQINEATEFREWSQRVSSFNGINKTSFWLFPRKTSQNLENVQTVYWN